jgi:hypothetical protein
MRGSKANRVSHPDLPPLRNHSTLMKNGSAKLSRNIDRPKAISRLYQEVSAQPATKQVCMRC